MIIKEWFLIAYIFIIFSNLQGSIKLLTFWSYNVFSFWVMYCKPPLRNNYVIWITVEIMINTRVRFTCKVRQPYMYLWKIIVKFFLKNSPFFIALGVLVISYWPLHSSGRNYVIVFNYRKQRQRSQIMFEEKNIAYMY